ncbi:uncharacterized protein LODBEIA_P21250 [Lodderomyces beijingensis]|uniref:ribonuclease Z n=1 Tax=Lodderomyces beijingensis TaxID=1775926 RepID=A0ABP0ZIC2_9ASCO
MFRFAAETHITDDTAGPLISLTTRDGSRYLFGKIPEGTQRTLNAVDTEFRYLKLQGIFITGTIFTWKDIGGLPGLFLTISDAMKKGVSVVGNSSLLSYIVATWRSFVFRKGIELDIMSVDKSPIVANKELVITSIQTPPKKMSNNETKTSVTARRDDLDRQVKKVASLMFPLDTSEVNSRDPESYKHDPSVRDLHTNVTLPPVEDLVPFQDSVSYCIDILPIRGKFDPLKAKGLGVKPGPQFRVLTEGESVVTEAGVTVTPQQVLGPEKIIPKVLIIDIPSDDYYENTITNQQFFEVGNVGLVYHLIGDKVTFNAEEYKQSFIDKFPPNCQHCISHKSTANNVVLNEKFTTCQLKLKLLSNGDFNLVNSEEFRDLPTGPVTRMHTLQVYGLNESGAKINNTRVSKASNKSLFIEGCLPSSSSSSSSSLPQMSTNVAFEDMKDSKFDLQWVDRAKQLKDSVHICTLGTGSSVPSIYRNALSTLLRIPVESNGGDISFKSVVLDAGENTIGSLLRNFFGHNNDDKELKEKDDDFEVIFKEMRLIYLSHLHADHHLGIPSLISKWFDINAKGNLYMIVPWQFINFIKDWYNLEGRYNDTVDMSRLKMFSCEDFIVGKRIPEFAQLSLDKFEDEFDRANGGGDSTFVNRRAKLAPRDADAISEMFQDCGLISVEATRALHCPFAYSSTFRFKLSADEDFKVSFSGDTRPNPKFAEVGRESDLLIHEATLDTELLEEAIAKKHSTLMEALAVCSLMKCPRLVLTHFSTRFRLGENIVKRKDWQKEAEALSKLLKSTALAVDVLEQCKDEEGKYNFDDLKVCYAYDLMNTRYGDIPKQEEIWQNTQQMFEVNERKRKLLDDELV